MAPELPTMGSPDDARALALARSRGYLKCPGERRWLRHAWQRWCRQARRPCITVVAGEFFVGNASAPRAIVSCDLPGGGHEEHRVEPHEAEALARELAERHGAPAGVEGE